MKKFTLVLLVLCAFSFVKVSAQNNIIRFSPLATIKFKAKLHYERGLTDKISAGAIGSYFFGAYPGFRIEPFGRYYFSDEALNGLYGQLKGDYSANSITINTTSGNTVVNTWTHSFSEYGVAVNLGYQFLLGRNDNVTFDIFTGYSYSSLKYIDNVDSATLTTEESENQAAELAYRLLHSNLFDFGLSVGYKF